MRLIDSLRTEKISAVHIMPHDNAQLRALPCMRESAAANPRLQAGTLSSATAMSFEVNEVARPTFRHLRSQNAFGNMCSLWHL